MQTRLIYISSLRNEKQTIEIERDSENVPDNEAITGEKKHTHTK